MKWYFALNEAGTKGDIALHTKLAVLSARKNTTLMPHLLYTGERNEFTDWLAENGVTIIQSTLPYLGAIHELVEQKRYSTARMGHWLRTNVCLEEKADQYVFYSDVDVSFHHDPYLDQIHPAFLSAAPQFDPGCWNYFNAGVMIVNVFRLLLDYPRFKDYLVRNLIEKTYNFSDQIAYNEFYRGRWDRLPAELNWKPYWGRNDNAALIHFNGPKVGAISAIVDGRWDHTDEHGSQIGSLFAHNVAHYSHYLRAALTNAPGLPAKDEACISHVIDKVAAYDPGPAKGDLSFMKFSMFGES